VQSSVAHGIASRRCQRSAGTCSPWQVLVPAAAGHPAPCALLCLHPVPCVMYCRLTTRHPCVLLQPPCGTLLVCCRCTSANVFITAWSCVQALLLLHSSRLSASLCTLPCGDCCGCYALRSSCLGGFKQDMYGQRTFGRAGMSWAGLLLLTCAACMGATLECCHWASVRSWGIPPDCAIPVWSVFKAAGAAACNRQSGRTSASICGLPSP
jgi:hypothetical protein